VRESLIVHFQLGIDLFCNDFMERRSAVFQIEPITDSLFDGQSSKSRVNEYAATFHTLIVLGSLTASVVFSTPVVIIQNRVREPGGRSIGQCPHKMRPVKSVVDCH
jgi:hypothetical protein